MIIKNITATNLMNAYVEWGSDPDFIDQDEWEMDKAQRWAKVIQGATSIREITDPNEFADALCKLGLSGLRVSHIYSFVNGSEGSFCLDADQAFMTNEAPRGWSAYENDEYYFVDSRTGLGVSIYPKDSFTFDEAIEAERNA